MRDIFTTPVIWFLLGFVFFMLEFVFPGFVIFFFGASAWIIAIITIFWDLSLNIQLLIFLGCSIATVLIFRSWFKRAFQKNKQQETTGDSDIIGQQCIADTAISPQKHGSVIFKGAKWTAKSEDTIAAGDTLLITGNESILLIVKSIPTI